VVKATPRNQVKSSLTSTTAAAAPADFEIKTLDQLKKERQAQQGHLVKDKVSTSEDWKTHQEAKVDDLQTRNEACKIAGKKVILVRRTSSKNYQKSAGSQECRSEHGGIAEESTSKTDLPLISPLLIINSKINSTYTSESDSELHSAPELSHRGPDSLAPLRKRSSLQGGKIASSRRKRTGVSLVRRQRKGEESGGMGGVSEVIPASSEEENLLESTDIGKRISISDLKNEM